jgi:hypothetical protein
MRLPIISASGITASRVLILLTLPFLRILSWTRSTDCLTTHRRQRIERGKVPAGLFGVHLAALQHEAHLQCLSIFHELLCRSVGFAAPKPPSCIQIEINPALIQAVTKMTPKGQARPPCRGQGCFQLSRRRTSRRLTHPRRARSIPARIIVRKALRRRPTMIESVGSRRGAGRRAQIPA